MILCVYKEMERTKPTLKLLRYFAKDYNIRLIEAKEPDDYDKALKDLWGKDDIIIVEHDMIFHRGQLEEIINCGHYLCAFNYYLYEPTTGLKEPVLAHRSIGETRRLHWNSTEDETADSVGFGMTKISLNFQRDFGAAWDKGTKGTEWKNLDTRFSFYAMKLKIKFDIHKDIVFHNHKG